MALYRGTLAFGCAGYGEFRIPHSHAGRPIGQAGFVCNRNAGDFEESVDPPRFLSRMTQPGRFASTGWRPLPLAGIVAQVQIQLTQLLTLPAVTRLFNFRFAVTAGLKTVEITSCVATLIDTVATFNQLLRCRLADSFNASAQLQRPTSVHYTVGL